MELSTSQLWMSRHDGEAETTAEIVSRALNGDRTAFEEIVLLHERRALTLAYRLIAASDRFAIDSVSDNRPVIRFLRIWSESSCGFVRRRTQEPIHVPVTTTTFRDLGR